MKRFSIVLLLCLAIGLAAVQHCYGQEKPKTEQALTAEQQKRVTDLWKDAELAGAKLEAAQKEVQNVQLQYNLALRQFMDDLDLSAKEWEFDNAKRLFRRKEKKQ